MALRFRFVNIICHLTWDVLLFAFHPWMHSPYELENKASYRGDRTISVYKSLTGKTMTEMIPRNAITETIRKRRSRSDLKGNDKERDNSQTSSTLLERQRRSKIETICELKKAQSQHENHSNDSTPGFYDKNRSEG